jgi:hypothetical protein
LTKIKKVWLNADPETGMGIHFGRPFPGMKQSGFYRRCEVPVDLIDQYEKALGELNKAKDELAKIFYSKLEK